MAGYTRQATANIVTGAVIDAADFNSEYNAIEAAFNGTTGHTHDGSTGNGPAIEVLGPANDFVVTSSVVRPKTDDTYDFGTSTIEWKDGFFDGTLRTDILTVDETSTFTGNVTASADLDVAGNLSVTGNAVINGNLTFGDASTDSISFGADIHSNILPDQSNLYDLGANGKQWKDLYIDGTANIDSLVADTADVNGGTIDNTVIGGTVAAAGSFTTLGASSGITGNVTGDLTGAVTGNVTGNVNGNLTGNVTGNVTGDTSGTHTGPVTGAVTGNVTGDLNGNVTGNVTGTVSSISNHDTGDLAEGTNLYFTNARAQAAISAGEGIDISAGSISAEDATTSNKGIASFNTTDFSVSSGAVSLKSESIQDIIGAMVTGNTETNISVTYNDSTGKLNFVSVDTDTNTTYTADGNYGMALSGTAFRLEDDRRRNATNVDIYSGNTHDYTHYDADIGIRWYANNGERARLENDGDLHVDGNITAYSGTVPSDKRLKHDIEKIDNALDKVSQINGYTFKYNNQGGKVSAGVIAQEVEKVLPSAVDNKSLVFHTGEQGVDYKTVQYDQLHGLLIEAIKELKEKLDECKCKKCECE